jgi:hypothetical protein
MSPQQEEQEEEQQSKWSKQRKISRQKFTFFHHATIARQPLCLKKIIVEETVCRSF